MFLIHYVYKHTTIYLIRVGLSLEGGSKSRGKSVLSESDLGPIWCSFFCHTETEKWRLTNVMVS